MYAHIDAWVGKKGPHQNLNKFPSKVWFMWKSHYNYLESYLDKVGGGGGGGGGPYHWIQVI